MMPGQDGRAKIKIVIVDDSSVFRNYWTRMIAGQPDLEVVASAVNGQEAIRKVKESRPDVVILDLEMPILDGISAIPLLLQEAAHIKILVASALTTEGSAHAVEALAKGASDYIPKPSTLDSSKSPESIKTELLSKIRAIVPRKVRAASLVTAREPFTAIGTETTEKVLQSSCAGIAIGSSTGGPNALETVLISIPKTLSTPIFITQHMPGFFITALAARLSKQTARPCHEPREDEVVQAGHIYIAPGDVHLMPERRGQEVIMRLSSAPAENFCRPAVDPMFRSLADVYGSQLLAVVLTGMGEDGKKGAEAVVEKGGVVIVQDEETSVVWGMPGAVVKAGLASKILPLNQIGPWIWNGCDKHLESKA